MKTARLNPIFVCLIGGATGIVVGSVSSSFVRSGLNIPPPSEVSHQTQKGDKSFVQEAYRESSFWTENPFPESAIKSAAANYRNTLGFADSAGQIAAILSQTPSSKLESLAEAAVIGLFSLEPIPHEGEVIDCLRNLPWVLSSRIVKSYIATRAAASPDETYDYVISILSYATPAPAPLAVKQFATQVTYDKWALINPGYAIGFLRSRLGPAEVNSTLKDSIGKLFTLSQDSAIKLLTQLGNEDPAAAAGIVAGSLMPAQSISLISGNLPEPIRQQFVSKYVDILAMEDPASIVSLASVLKPTSLASSTVTVALRAIASVDPTMIEQWLSDMPPAQKASALAPAIPLVSGTAGGRTIAALYIDSISEGAEVDRFSLMQCMWNLRDEDVEKSMLMIEQLRGEDTEKLRAMVLGNKASTLDPNDPSALQTLLASSPPELKTEVINRAFAQWSKEDYLTAIRAADAIGEPELRRVANLAVLGDPKGRIPLEERERMTFELIQKYQFTDDIVPAVNKLISEAASTDIDSAVSYINRLAPGESRDAVSVTFVRKWAELDAVSTAKWIEEYPEGRLRDMLSAELVSCARDQPENALTWASSIRDPQLRISAAREVANAWGMDHSSGIREALKAANFSGKEIGEVLSSKQ